ncbi:MAG: GatB/YqeY domain-containing protein [Candidatus Daviesbacteria bacterium]|nr:GatB/YqeY domain-containing protein [Candidatus Daviesbacteria bacterium]
MLDRIQNDLRKAQLNRDEVKVSTLRLLLSEVKNGEISKRELLSDNDVISIIQREVKKRKEAAEGFRSGDREESAVKEELEAKVLTSYLPAQMSSEELTKLVEETIQEVGVSSVADMGKVIGAVMGKVKGQADGGQVSSIVKERLSNG